jgi:MFS transporter, BCD family, chlorophyll transporter
LVNPATGYSFVYHIEIYMLFATLIAIGPLVRRKTLTLPAAAPVLPHRFGLAEMPN